MKQFWKQAQKFERQWWDTCTNTLGEEIKQLEYANRMGLTFSRVKGKMVIDVKGKTIADIGAGPVSLLLKTINSPKMYAIDPCEYPEWIYDRYIEANIMPINSTGEDMDDADEVFDEVWIYNCLQHVIDPEKVIQNAKKLGKVIRIFEWIDLPAHEGHPHELKADELDKWLGGVGQVAELNSNGCIGRAYFGMFKTENEKEI